MGHAVGPFHLLSPGPLARADMLKGARIASPGPPWDSLLLHLGARPAAAVEASLAGALERGNIDAVLGPAALLSEPALARRVRAVTAVHLGIYRVASPFTASLGFWRTLMPEERAVLLQAAPAGLAAAALAYRTAAEEARRAMRDAGIAFSRAHPEAMQKALGFDPDAVELSPEGEKTLAAGLRRLHDKYSSLFAAEDPSVASVAGILRREVFDRLDPDKYGLRKWRFQ